MKFEAVFPRLIRWPNLVFIIITQILFYRIFFPFAYQENGGSFADVKLKPQLFYILVITSVLIAAAGYIINDYFDINIDNINKPGQTIIGNHIHPKTALTLYSLFSAAGLFLSGYLTIRLENGFILFLNFISVILLLLYSATFKKKMIIGNLIVAALTSWVILILVVAEIRFSPGYYLRGQILLKFAVLYGAFAFITSLIREIVKDMEDIKGDRTAGCKTMPIVWGIPQSKIIAAIWMAVLSLAIVIIAVYLLKEGKWIGGGYGIVFILTPLMVAAKKLIKAVNPTDFHKLSTMIKVIMLTGILSMLFIWY